MASAGTDLAISLAWMARADLPERRRDVTMPRT